MKIARIAAFGAALSFGFGLALAQGAGGPFSGLGADSDQPISVSADTQTADFQAETVTYSGNVRIVQGSLTLRAARVTAKAPGGRIASVEADGDVVVTSKDATARSPRGLYDVAARRISLSGGVVLTQGENTLTGSDLVVELKTGQATLTQEGGRVEGVFQPGEAR